MDRISLSKLKMYIVVLALLNKRIAIWVTNLAFKGQVDALDAGIKKIKEKDVINKKSNSVTKGKAQKRKKMLKSAEAVCNAGIPYAMSIKDDALLEKFNFTYRGLRKGNEAEVYNRCKNIALATVGIAPQLVLYNMPLGEDVTLTAACEAYGEAIADPKDIISAGKSANKIMHATSKEMDILLDKGLDKMVDNYAEANPEFYVEYGDARFIGGWSKPPVTPVPPPTPPIV